MKIFLTGGTYNNRYIYTSKGISVINFKYIKKAIQIKIKEM